VDCLRIILERFANWLVGDYQTKGSHQYGEGSSGPTASREQGPLF